MSHPQLVLASSSPYRQALLKQLKLSFICHRPDIDEQAHPHETPEQTALRLAERKARKVQEHYPDAIIIGSDQVADLNGQHLGKPNSQEGALAQLAQMQGQTAVFHTGLCVLYKEQCLLTDITTHCEYRTLTTAEIHAYVNLEPAFDVAGSAKIEALGISLMSSVQSNDPSALVGLPLIALTTFLRQLGINPLHITS